MKTDGIRFFKVSDNREESEWQYYAMINPDITHGLLQETYDIYGLQIGEVYAGDYCAANPEGSFHSDLERVIRDKFDIDDDAEIDIESISAAPEAEEVGITINGEENEEMSKFATLYARENSNYTQADYINYWDGHNRQSIILECDWPEAIDMTEIDDEDIIDELTKVCEQFNTHCEGASKTEVIDGYEIGCSRYQDDPWDCYLRNA